MQRQIIVCAALLALFACPVLGGEVIFNNGDHLTGKVTSVDGGKLKITSDVAGEVTVDLKDVKTFSTDEPMQVRMQDKSIVHEKIAAVPTTQAVEVSGKTVPLDQLKKVGGKEVWTGSVIVNGSLARGNSHSMDLGVAVDASLRRDDEFLNDRISLSGAYNFGKQRDTNGVDTTSADNWFAQTKYDKFFTDQWYGYGIFRYDHDRLADLNYRLAPGVGVGYQWVESADFNFSTEAGVSYVFEDYSNDGTDERVALRLAYHVDKKLNDKVSIFHNLEWLPAFEDPGDYNLNTDAGIRAKMTDKLFSEFKVLYQRDSTPAPGAEKNDVRLMLGVGWSF